MATAKMSEQEMEQRARLESMKNAEAEGKAVFNKSVIQDNCKVTLGYLWNAVKDYKDLVVYDTHNWSGDVTEPYPNPLTNALNNPNGGTFIHQGSKGSKAGVVYVDGTDSNARKWLVAFDTPNDKCYVECGPIGPTDWNLIEAKLNNSGNYNDYIDIVSGGRAHAHVYDHPDEQDVNRRRLDVDFRA